MMMTKVSNIPENNANFCINTELCTANTIYKLNKFTKHVTTAIELDLRNLHSVNEIIETITTRIHDT